MKYNYKFILQLPLHLLLKWSDTLTGFPCLAGMCLSVLSLTLVVQIHFSLSGLN